jgi:hypothetical protein
MYINAATGGVLQANSTCTETPRSERFNLDRLYYSEHIGSGLASRPFRFTPGELVPYTH